MINTYSNITLKINCNIFPKPHEYYEEFITNFTSYHDNRLGRASENRHDFQVVDGANQNNCCFNYLFKFVCAFTL